MKIDDIYNKLSIINSTAESAAGKRSDSPDEGTTRVKEGQTPGTRVDLSGTSVELNKVAELMDKESIERSEKVSEIKAMLASDQYRVDEQKVADKILKEALTDLVGP